MRVLDCQLSLLDKSHGSALFQQGETKVFCAVYGPAEVKVHKEIIDQATVECILKRKTEKSGVQERHFEELISTTCKEILLATMHPRSAIQINLQVMQDAGSLLSCLLNSSCMSLVHAGLPMKAMFVSVCCGITNQDEYICDPNEEKEKDCKCLMTLTYETANFSLLSSYTTGQFSVEEYFKCLRLAKMTAQEVAAFQRVALERFLSKDVIKDDDEDMRNEQMDRNNDNSEVRET